MNFYFLVEGEQTEKKVYKAWTALVFPGIQHQVNMDDLKGNDFFVFSSNGYPFAKGFLDKTLQDIRSIACIDHLFVCVDADDDSVEIKRNQLTSQLQELQCPCPFSVIVANCCIETWFLGNQNMMPEQPTTGTPLHTLWNHYDVRNLDPESMPKPDGFNRSTAKFHLEYLQAMFRENQTSYTKNFPRLVHEPNYLTALAQRCQSTNHLDSFKTLLNIWSGLGGTCPPP
ncbi:MAG: hypothetical protein HQL93_01430 [Magnetococcales bacterium]|nr:hypothetical protein [Magnetococcales bacterium]